MLNFILIISNPDYLKYTICTIVLIYFLTTFFNFLLFRHLLKCGFLKWIKINLYKVIKTISSHENPYQFLLWMSISVLNIFWSSWIGLILLIILFPFRLLWIMMCVIFSFFFYFIILFFYKIRILGLNPKFFYYSEEDFLKMWKWRRDEQQIASGEVLAFLKEYWFVNAVRYWLFWLNPLPYGNEKKYRWKNAVGENYLNLYFFFWGYIIRYIYIYAFFLKQWTSEILLWNKLFYSDLFFNIYYFLFYLKNYFVTLFLYKYGNVVWASFVFSRLEGFYMLAQTMIYHFMYYTPWFKNYSWYFKENLKEDESPIYIYLEYLRTHIYTNIYRYLPTKNKMAAFHIYSMSKVWVLRFFSFANQALIMLFVWPIIAFFFLSSILFKFAEIFFQNCIRWQYQLLLKWNFGISFFLPKKIYLKYNFTQLPLFFLSFIFYILLYIFKNMYIYITAVVFLIFKNIFRIFFKIILLIFFVFFFYLNTDLSYLASVVSLSLIWKALLSPLDFFSNEFFTPNLNIMIGTENTGFLWTEKGYKVMTSPTPIFYMVLDWISYLLERRKEIIFREINDALKMAYRLKFVFKSKFLQEDWLAWIYFTLHYWYAESVAWYYYNYWITRLVLFDKFWNHLFWKYYSEINEYYWTCVVLVIFFKMVVILPFKIFMIIIFFITKFYPWISKYLIFVFIKIYPFLNFFYSIIKSSIIHIILLMQNIPHLILNNFINFTEIIVRVMLLLFEHVKTFFLYFYNYSIYKITFEYFSLDILLMKSFNENWWILKSISSYIDLQICWNKFPNLLEHPYLITNTLTLKYLNLKSFLEKNFFYEMGGLYIKPFLVNLDILLNNPFEWLLYIYIYWQLYVDSMHIYLQWPTCINNHYYDSSFRAFDHIYITDEEVYSTNEYIFNNNSWLLFYLRFFNLAFLLEPSMVLVDSFAHLETPWSKFFFTDLSYRDSDTELDDVVDFDDLFNSQTLRTLIILFPELMVPIIFFTAGIFYLYFILLLSASKNLRHLLFTDSTSLDTEINITYAWESFRNQAPGNTELFFIKGSEQEALDTIFKKGRLKDYYKGFSKNTKEDSLKKIYYKIFFEKLMNNSIVLAKDNNMKNYYNEILQNFWKSVKKVRTKNWQEFGDHISPYLFPSILSYYIDEDFSNLRNLNLFTNEEGYKRLMYFMACLYDKDKLLSTVWRDSDELTFSLVKPQFFYDDDYNLHLLEFEKELAYLQLLSNKIFFNNTLGYWVWYLSNFNLKILHTPAQKYSDAHFEFESEETELNLPISYIFWFASVPFCLFYEGISRITGYGDRWNVHDSNLMEMWGDLFLRHIFAHFNIVNRVAEFFTEQPDFKSFTSPFNDDHDDEPYIPSIFFSYKRYVFWADYIYNRDNLHFKNYILYFTPQKHSENHVLWVIPKVMILLIFIFVRKPYKMFINYIYGLNTPEWVNLNISYILKKNIRKYTVWFWR